MKHLCYLFLLANFCQPLYSNFYVDSLDTMINQEAKFLAGSSYKVEEVISKINKNIKKKASLQEIDAFLHHEGSVAFFFCNEVQSKLNESLVEEGLQLRQSFNDLQFGLGVKIFLYYLECCKQKMMYKAVKNYDTLNYWKNEKFNEDQITYSLNIFRWFSKTPYQKEVENNIVQLEEISKQTNSFLGLVRYSQHILGQAKTQQECKEKLMTVVKLQDDFLHISDKNYDSFEISTIVTDSIDKVYRFSLYLSEQYAQCQTPSHFKRHWKAYTLTAATLYVCGFIYSHYGDELINSSQHFWDEHMQGPLNRNIQILSGYTSAPELPIEQHKEKIKDLIEAGFKMGSARGDETSLHDALARDCDTVSGGEFSAKFKEIDDKMAMVDDMLKKAKPAVDELSVWYQRYKEFKEEHPNMLWGDWYKYFVGTRDPVFSDVYQKGSRNVGNDIYSFVSWRDQSKTFDDQPKGGSQSVVDPLFVVPDANLQETFKYSAGELGQATQNLPELTQSSAPDVSTWTFEQKKQYVEEQHKTITTNPYKNILRLGEPYLYKVEEESLQAKKMVNKFSQDLHVILGLTALIPMLTVIGGSLFASKTMYNSVAYQPIRTLVHRLEVLLNESLYESVVFDREGYLYFLTEQLKLNIGVLTNREQKLIDADIAALQSYDLDYTQKFNVVQRMYRTYPCLVPVTI